MPSLNSPRLRRVFPIVWFAAAAWVVPPSHANQTFEEKLTTRVDSFRTSGQPLLKVILELAYEYRLPLSVQYVDESIVEKPLNLHLEDASVHEVFSAVVNEVAGYKVAFSDGVVEIYSETTRSDETNILNTVIDRFEVVQVTAPEAGTRLKTILFQKWNPGAGFGGHIPYGSLAPSVRRVTVRVRAARIFEILNAIVSSDGEALWIAGADPTEEGWSRRDPLWSIYSLNPAGKEFIVSSVRRHIEESRKVPVE